MRLQLDALNLFNAQANQIEYLLRVSARRRTVRRRPFDRHLHPVEPLAIRLTLAGPL